MKHRDDERIAAIITSAKGDLAAVHGPLLEMMHKDLTIARRWQWIRICRAFGL